MLGMSSVTVSSIRNGIDGDDGVGIASTTVQYACGGSSTTPPAYYLTDQNGAYLVDENGVYLINGEWQDTQPDVPPGFYLWARTVTKYDDGKESCTYSIAREGVGVIKEQRQYYVSSSITSLEDGYWTYEAPTEIPDGYYLWERVALQLDDGSISYSDAVFQSLMSDVMFNVDKANKQIESKVWEEDISGQISEYDKSCVLDMSHKETYMQQTLSSIWTSITDQNTQTIVKPDGTSTTTMAYKLNETKKTADGNQTKIQHDILGEDGYTLSVKTIAEQSADRISWIVKSGTSASNFTLTDRTSSLTADYINNNGLVTFNGLDKTTVRDRIGKSENILSTWTGDATLATTTINGGFIDTHTIVAKHLATSAIQSYGTKNSDGTYTGEYSRTKNKTFSTRGSLFDMSNGNIFTPGFSIINVVPSGETQLTAGAYFAGNVAAYSGSIGGWTISDGILYYAASTPGPTSMILKPGGIAATGIAGQTSSKTWAFTIKDKFGVATDGVLYSTGADITGKITANTGTIGGININSSYGIYTGTKQRADSTESGFLIQKEGGIYLGKYNSTRGSTAFQVNPEGYVKAYDIHAYGGDIGGWNITSSALYSGTATTTLKPESGRIILSPSGITPSPAVNVGGSGTASKTWTITAGTKFGVTDTGELWCQDANVSGTITATGGNIGGCQIVNNVLKVGSANIDSINGSKITAGTIVADRLQVNNLGDISDKLGTITSGQIGDSINGITIGSDSTSAWIYYDKVSLVGDIGSNGFYIGTDGIAFGKNNTFKMTKDGVGNIGPWYIDGTSISKKGTNTTSQIQPSTFKESGTGNMYFGNNGLSISDVFYVDSNGSLTAENATITGTIYADTYKMFFIDRNQIKYATDVIKAESIKGQLSAAITIGTGEDSGIQYPANIQLIYSNTEEIDNIKAGTIVISAPVKIQFNSNNVTTNNLFLNTKLKIGNNVELTTDNSDSRLKVNSDLRASTIFSDGTYRAFYDYNQTLPCIEVLLNAPNGLPSGAQSGSYIKYGSSTTYNCMAMPINGDDIYFKIKSSSTSSGYTWYSLRSIASGSGGGGGYTDGSGITFSVNGSTTTISVDPSYIRNSVIGGEAIHPYKVFTDIFVYDHGSEDYYTDTANTLSVGYPSNSDTISFDKPQRLRRSTSSSKRYKHYINDVSIEQALEVLKIPVVNFKYKDGHIAKDDELYGKTMPGFFAEDVDTYVKVAAQHNPDGSCENWKERIILPLMLRVIQDQQKRIEELEKKLNN